jgi:hypothetical protein
MSVTLSALSQEDSLYFERIVPALHHIPLLSIAADDAH